MSEACDNLTEFDKGGGMLLELVVLLLVFYSLMILTEEYLMELIDKLIEKYSISQQMAGIIIAVGSIVPEFTTNMFASLSDSDDLQSFGLGTIIGAGSYDFTVWIGVAAIMGRHKKLQVPFYSMMRDYMTYLISLIMIGFIMFDMKIFIPEAFLLVALLPAYITTLALTGELISHPICPTSPITSPRDEEVVEVTHGPGLIPPVLTQFYNTTPVSYFLGIIKKPIVFVYDWTIPQKTESFGFICLAFSVIMTYNFFFTNYTVMIVENIACYIQVSEMLIGITLITWGNNIGDLINAGVAAKRGMATLALASVLTTQIFNIQFSVGFPWFLSTLKDGTMYLQDDEMWDSLIVVFVVVACSFIALWICQMKLRIRLTVLLVVIYIVFATYEFAVVKLYS